MDYKDVVNKLQKQIEEYLFSGKLKSCEGLYRIDGERPSVLKFSLVDLEGKERE